MALPPRLTYAQRLEMGPQRISEQMSAGSADGAPAQCSLTISQLEAWSFVKRISLDGLWNQPVGPGRQVLESMDWVGRMLPPVPAVYFVCVEDVTGIMPIYIGMTRAGLDKRIGSHHGVSPKTAREYAKSFINLRYIPICDAMDISVIEAAAISFWDPPLNIQKPMPSKIEIERYILELKELLG